MKTVLISSFSDEKCIASIIKMGYNVIKLPPYGRLDEPVMGHPDMLSFYDSNERELVMAREYYFINKAFFDRLAESLNIKIIAEDIVLDKKYPLDIAYDALPLNNVLYGKEGFVSNEIKKRFKKFVPVNQGYTRCSCAALSESCAVTADKGMAEALKKDGINVLEISEGNISLDGYEYGFIGGAGGRLGDTYCFFGDAVLHPDGEKILNFARENKIKTAMLSDMPLSDHGGFIEIF